MRQIQLIGYASEQQTNTQFYDLIQSTSFLHSYYPFYALVGVFWDFFNNGLKQELSMDIIPWLPDPLAIMVIYALTSVPQLEDKFQGIDENLQIQHHCQFKQWIYDFLGYYQVDKPIFPKICGELAYFEFLND